MQSVETSSNPPFHEGITGRKLYLNSLVLPLLAKLGAQTQEENHLTHSEIKDALLTRRKAYLEGIAKRRYLKPERMFELEQNGIIINH